MLYFLTQSFRARLLNELPPDKHKMNKETQYLTHRSKALIKELAHIDLELAQMVVSEEDGKTLTEWSMIEIVRDLPRLIRKEK
ncbi:MAG: hypothetical protein IKI21_03235 [Oscillospiraceae bacterium]|nr:hypothetical protein [Oscillospiraceae bacterium]